MGWVVAVRGVNLVGAAAATRIYNYLLYIGGITRVPVTGVDSQDEHSLAGVVLVLI